MGSVTILDKSEVLSGLFGTWDSIDQLLAGLSEQQWQTPTPLPGWCVHDVVAHMIGTESSLQGVSAPDADIDLNALDHVRNGVGAVNEAWVRHLSSESGAVMLQRFRSVTADRRKRLSAMSVDDWNAPTPSPVGLESFGRFMRVRLFDCWMHEQDIRDRRRVGRRPTRTSSGPAAAAVARRDRRDDGVRRRQTRQGARGFAGAVRADRPTGPRPSASPSTAVRRWSTISAGTSPRRRSASMGCCWHRLAGGRTAPARPGRRLPGRRRGRLPHRRASEFRDLDRLNGRVVLCRSQI